MASVLANVAGTVPYYCNLVGAGFSPCATNAGYTGAGAGYPINFFVANPFASGTNPGFGPPNATGQLVAAGYSNYHALQIDLRQNNWHGLQYDANYTWSHSLGVDSNNQWTGRIQCFHACATCAKSYGPSLFDLRHVLHANGTYDLAFRTRTAIISTIAAWLTLSLEDGRSAQSPHIRPASRSNSCGSTTPTTTTATAASL